jgi:hypothetical protein
MAPRRDLGRVGGPLAKPASRAGFDSQLNFDQAGVQAPGKHPHNPLSYSGAFYIPIWFMNNEHYEPKLPAALPAGEDSIAAAIELVLSNPDALAEAVSRACPEGSRRDGWTPFARKLFQVLAETGSINLACEYIGLSRPSAYGPEARDPLFAAAMAAASHLARNPLADTIPRASRRRGDRYHHSQRRGGRRTPPLRPPLRDCPCSPASTSAATARRSSD